MQDIQILSILTFLPLLGVVFIILGKLINTENYEKISKVIALTISSAVFITSLFLIVYFDKSSTDFQFFERTEIMKGLFTYQMGIDGISILFILLTTFLTPVCILASWNSINDRIDYYMSSFLILETLMIGTFCSLDIVMFYIFFESVLIPMFIIIGIWGGERRVYSAFKFFLYTLLGSILMLAAIIFIILISGTTELPLIYENLNINKGMTQNILWLAFFASFAVKMPMWPVHTWLPDAHVEAPTAGSVILAAILLKMGGYGFLRFSLPMFPDASLYFSNFVFFLSIVAIIYTSIVAYVQEDIKKLIAYSSVAHMGFVTMGIFTFSINGIQGSIFQMFSHGLISGALFLSVGVVYERMHTRKISDYGGVVSVMPKFAVMFMIFTLANIGLPGTSGFIGEFLTIIALFSVSKTFAFFAASGVILSAVYGLWLYRKVIFEKISNEAVKALKDLSFREKVILIPLVILIILFGVYPMPVLDLISASSIDLSDSIKFMHGDK
ncbi:MAG: NADH-quinone oxidoreductase subunit M [Pseudomonadota bacterium]|nr:NADH-quinone oxidoreductase subunit M [Pseudomonadota bacterium]